MANMRLGQQMEGTLTKLLGIKLNLQNELLKTKGSFSSMMEKYNICCTEKFIFQILL